MEQQTAYVEVRITAPDAATATRLARLLVEERLAACAKVLPPMTSVYRWEGAVETASEHLLLVTSTGELFEDIRRRVRSEHPYDTPEVLGVPVVAVDARYAAWLDASTEEAKGTKRTHGSEDGTHAGEARDGRPDGGDGIHPRS